MSLIVSASQIKNYQRCPRLWWWEKCRRMPRTGTIYGIVFGNVLHACLERWLLADASGRDADGNFAEVYPPGWEWDEENKQRITEEDAELIPRLIAEAIEKGILVRHHGRQVEKSFTGILTRGPGIFGPHVFLTGKIDLALHNQVQDHKGTKGMRYALSKEKLANDLQLLIYARERLEANPQAEKITLRHNVFDRIGGTVKQTTATVDADTVREHWENLEPLGHEMLQLKLLDLPDERWHEVACPPEEEQAEACGAFGGCRFIPVCFGQETPKEMRRRLGRLRLPEAYPVEETMSLQEKLAKAKAKAKKNPEPEKEEKSAPVLNQEPEPEPTTTTAPPAPAETAAKSPSGPTLQSPREELKKLTKGKLLDLIEHTAEHTTESTFLPQGELLPFEIYRGCRPSRGHPAPVVHVSDALRVAVERVGEDSLEEFYQADGFKRRDQLKAMARKIKEELSPCCLVVPNQVSTDEKDMVAALIPYCDLLVEALA